MVSNHWKRYRLSDVCEINPKKKELSELGMDVEVSFLPMSAVSAEGNMFPKETRKLKDVIKGYTYFRDDDVLMAKITPCFENGKRAIAKGLKNKIGFGSTEFHVLRPCGDVISKWIFYAISRDDFRNIAKSQMTGTAGQKRVPSRILEEFEIPVPCKDVQENITDYIETQFTRLDASVKALQTIKEKLELYRKSVLNDAFSGVPVRSLQLFCKNFKADIVDGPFGSNMKRSDYVSKGIPVLKIQNIKPFKIVLKKMDYVTKEKYISLKRHSFKPNDIIITKLGEPLGISAIVPNELKKGIIVADLVRVRVENINLDYLCYALNSPFISRYINSKQKGTTRARVKLSIVRELPIPFIDKEQQKQIVVEIESRFSVIDKIEETVNHALVKAERLRKSILKSAFEGKLV